SRPFFASEPKLASELDRYFSFAKNLSDSVMADFISLIASSMSFSKLMNSP
ncbi:hypothetical protein VINI7043_15180, partial [Vibrio nigripulchritudo ATCC 27043]